MVTGHQTILVHHQTGIAAITATALGYQVSHLSAAKVPSPVSEYSTIKACQNIFHLLKIFSFKCGFSSDIIFKIRLTNVHLNGKIFRNLASSAIYALYNQCAKVSNSHL